MSETSPLRSVLKWYPLIIPLVLLLIAGAETRYQVAQLVADKQGDIAQWRLLREQTQLLTNHSTQINELQRHMTPQAIQAWGRIQGIVTEDHQRLNQHLRNHQ